MPATLQNINVSDVHKTRTVTHQSEAWCYESSQLGIEEI